MALVGSPKALVKDVAGGYLAFTPLVLKRFTPEEIKAISTQIDLLLREMRGQAVSARNIPALREKNLRLGRLNEAHMVLTTYCKKNKVLL